MRLLAHLRAAPRVISAQLKAGYAWAGGFGPTFWQFIFGLGFIFFGIHRFSAGMSWFLVGLLLVWDATRPASKS